MTPKVAVAKAALLALDAELGVAGVGLAAIQAQKKSLIETAKKKVATRKGSTTSATWYGVQSSKNFYSCYACKKKCGARAVCCDICSAWLCVKDVNGCSGISNDIDTNELKSMDFVCPHGVFEYCKTVHDDLASGGGAGGLAAAAVAPNASAE
jgi:hypothetical protein